MSQKKINLGLRDRPRLNKLLEPDMLKNKELDRAGEEYFLRATPSDEDLTINLKINGETKEVYIPEFLGAEITKQTTGIKKATQGYKMWAIPKK
jgi:hypothetical protein